MGEITIYLVAYYILICPTRCNVAQFIYLETALHVSGGIITHHQERKQLYIQHLVFVTPLLLPAAIAAGNSNGMTNTRCRDTVVCASDDGWWYYPKHVEQFPDK